MLQKRPGKYFPRSNLKNPLSSSLHNVFLLPSLSLNPELDYMVRLSQQKRLVCIIWLLKPGLLGVIPPRLLALGHPHSPDGDEDEEDKEEEEEAYEGEKRGERETRGGIGLHCTQGGRRRGGRGWDLVREN